MDIQQYPEHTASSALSQASAALKVSDVNTALLAAELATSLLGQSQPASVDHVRARLLWGSALTLAARYTEASQRLESALADAEQQSLTQLACDIRCELAMVCGDGIGLHDLALVHASLALEIAESAQLPLAEVKSLMRLAGASARIEPNERSERLGLLALSLSRDQHFDTEVWRSLATLSMVATCIANAPDANDEVCASARLRALDYARRAYGAAQGIAPPQALANTLLNQVEALERLGRSDEADQARAQVLSLCRSHGIVRYELSALREGADSLMRRGRLEEAYAVLMALCQRSELHDNIRVRYYCLRSAYLCCKRMGRFEDALAHFEDFHALDLQRAAAAAKAQIRFAQLQGHLKRARSVVARVGDSVRALQVAARAQGGLDRAF